MITPSGPAPLPQEARPYFEEGARLLFSRWTALCLALENEWGGANSREKGQWLLQEAVQWFYRNKGGWGLLHAVALQGWGAEPPQSC